MYLNAFRKLFHGNGKASSSCDLESHYRNLMWSFRNGKWLLDTTYLQHKNSARPKFHSALNRNRVNDSSVEIMPIPDLDRRQKPRDGTRGKNGINNGARSKPMLPRCLDASSHAFKPDGQLLDPLLMQCLLEKGS
jgi:hypothetical protein